MSTTPSCNLSSQESVFHEALNRFKDSLGNTEREEFQFTTLDDLQDVIKSIQDKQASEKKMRNMKRLKKFLEGMDEYGKVIEVFLNASEFVAFVWGPMKFLLVVASTYAQAFDALLEMYQAIGEQLPLLTQYQTLFQINPHMKRVLELIYADILEFHTNALKYFKQKSMSAITVWKQLFQATWKNFRTRFSGIIDNFRRHKILIESQASIVQFEQFERARAVAEEEFKTIRVNEDKRRQIVVRDWLGSASTEADQEYYASIRAPYPETGRWLLEKKQVQTWLDPNSSSIPYLWLTGIPGAGKTILASLLVEEARKLDRVQVLFFYCKHHDSQRDSFLAVARSLLWQLRQLDENLSGYLYENASTCGESSLQSINLAKDMLDIALRKLEKVYIILDGLDECPIKEKKLIASWFCGIVDSITESEPEAIRCFFVSQDDNDCGKLLRSIPVVKISSSDNGSDILGFCDSWGKEIQRKFSLSEAERRSIVTEVTQRANGMFLFAKLVMKNLHSQTSRAKLNIELQPGMFPKRLDEAYARIVDRILKEADEPESEDAAKILGWLVCAKRPLKWHEIQGAVSLDLEARSFDFEGRKLRVDSKDLCGSLIEINLDNTIIFVHETARHYLVNKKIVLVGKEEYNLAVLCIFYLSCSFFDLSISSQAIEEFVLEGCYAFSDYAFVHWLDHLECGSLELGKLNPDSTELLAAEIQEFLSRHFSTDESGHFTTKPAPERFRSFHTYGFFDRLAKAADFWRNHMRVKVQDSDRTSISDLDKVLGRIRSTVDELASRKLSTSLAQKLRTFHGPKIFKCFRYDCEFFHKGFDTIQERDKHHERHKRAYYCTFPCCPKAIFGFIDLKMLQQHIASDHSTGQIDDSKFPVYQEPKSINIKQAIKTGDIAAVERWAQQFEGNLPNDAIGIHKSFSREGISYRNFDYRKPIDLALQRADSKIAGFFFKNIEENDQLTHSIIYRLVFLRNYSLFPWALRIPLKLLNQDKAYQAISLAITRGEDDTGLQLLKYFNSIPGHLELKKEKSYVTMASQFGCLSCLQYLIVDCKMDADFVDRRERTALMTAAEMGRTDIVKFLVDGGRCNGNYTNPKGESAVQKAAINGYEQIIHILSPQHQLPDPIGYWLKVAQLRKAARNGNLKDVCRILDDIRVPADAADIGHYTPFLHAIENGHSSIVNVLLDRRGDSINLNRRCNCHHPRVGSNLKWRESFGATALFLASIHGHASIVRRLLECEKIETERLVLMKGQEYRTALDIAEYNKDFEIAKLILDYKARKQPAASSSDIPSSPPQQEISENHNVAIADSQPETPVMDAVDIPSDFDFDSFLHQ